MPTHPPTAALLPRSPAPPAPPAPPCSDQATVRCCNRSAAPTATVSPPYAVSVLRLSAIAGHRYASDGIQRFPFSADKSSSPWQAAPTEAPCRNTAQTVRKPRPPTLFRTAGPVASCPSPACHPKTYHPKTKRGTPSGAPPPVPTAGRSDLIRHLPYEGPHALHLGLLFELAQRLHHGGHLLVLDDRQHRGVHGRPGV